MEGNAKRPMNGEQWLFEVHQDLPLTGTGRVRAYTGNVIEEVACACLRWERQRIDGNRKVCVDAVDRDKQPVEIKAVSMSKGVPASVIYDFRIRKELEAYPDMDYAFVLHRAKQAGSLRKLREMIASQPLEVIRVRAWIVWQMLEHLPLRKIVREAPVKGERTGYKRTGYREGYRCLDVREFLKNLSPWEYTGGVTLQGLEYTARIARHGTALSEPLRSRVRREAQNIARITR